MKFIDKVRTKTMSFIIDDTELYTAICVIVETTDGRKLTVKDDSSPYGVVGADSRKEALKKGNDFLSRMEEIGKA